MLEKLASIRLPDGSDDFRPEIRLVGLSLTVMLPTNTEPEQLGCRVRSAVLYSVRLQVLRMK
jgi:hypothetical protein